MNKSRKFAKKRMMFIQKEDYNFLTYNFLLFLNELKCYNQEKKFNDFRRIAYLIELVSSNLDYDELDKVELNNIYLRAQLKKKLLSHLMITLKNKGYLGISLNTTHRTLDIWINKEKIPDDFFNNQLFESEINNIKKIKKVAKITLSQKLKTMVDNIYGKKGVQTWEI